MPNPDFQVTVKDGAIAVSGRLDFTTAKQALLAVNTEMAAQWQSSQAVESSAATQTIDLGGVTHSNSAGLALMIEWLAEAQRARQTIRFANIPDSLRQISTVCQVDSLI